MLRKWRGFTLPELMIALAISLFIMLAITVFFQTSSSAAFNSMKMVRLNGVLRSAIDFMGREIMRAGYWSTSQTYIGSRNPPLTGVPDFATIDPFKTIAVANYDGTACTSTSCNCIVFAYDRPPTSNGTASGATTGVIETTEYTGYRLNGTVIEYKNSGTAFTCTDGAWSVLTPSKVAISNLRFDVVNSSVQSLNATNTITNRAVTVTIAGHFATDSTISASLTDTIDVRNDVIN